MALNNINTESPSRSPYTQEVRRVVREELSKSQLALSRNMYSRTPDLIRASSIDVQNRFSTINHPFTSEDVWGNKPVLLQNQKLHLHRVDVNNEMLSGYIEIQPHFTESDIQSCLVEIFHKKNPLISNKDFELLEGKKYHCFSFCQQRFLLEL